MVILLYVYIIIKFFNSTSVHQFETIVAIVYIYSVLIDQKSVCMQTLKKKRKDKKNYTLSI